MDKAQTQAPKWRRRALIGGVALAAAGWVVGLPRLLTLGTGGLAFEDIPDLPPFRRLTGTGAPSTGNVALIGLDAPDPDTPAEARAKQIARADLATALYGPVQNGSVSGSVSGPIPVAVFTDFACPICRVMETRLDDLRADIPDAFRIVWHQLPILSPASHTASRAVIAAGQQGAFAAMHARLQRAPVITDEAFILTLARDLNLDLAQFRQDLTSQATEAQLLNTRALADIFGFYGTPAFAIGHTVFLGAVPKSTLRDLIEEAAQTTGM